MQNDQRDADSREWRSFAFQPEKTVEIRSPSHWPAGGDWKSIQPAIRGQRTFGASRSFERQANGGRWLLARIPKGPITTSRK